MENLISVVIPIYNIEEYLIKCINSILRQSYKYLQIILVDDGSTDSCPAICDEYAQKDNRVQVIHKKNGGLSDARNKGIEFARGEYITFIDSDDYVELDYIQYLCQLLEDNQADMSVCQRNEVFEESGKIIPRIQTGDKVIEGNKKCMEAFFTDPSIDTVAWGKLYRTSMFKKVRYPFGKYNEDVFTTYLLIAQCNTISVGHEHKYNYLQRKNGISKSEFQMKHLDAIEGNKIRSAFIKKYYPECLVYSNAGIIYATNNCVIKIIESGRYLPDIIMDLQKNYRKYEFDFLRGRSSVKAKAFSILAWMNLKLLVNSLQKFTN